MGSVIRAWQLSCHKSCGILVPRPDMEPVCTALEGRFLSIGPSEKSPVSDFKSYCLFYGCRSLYLSVLFWRFFDVDHLQHFYWICYNVVSVFCFSFLASRHVKSLLPDQELNPHPLRIRRWSPKHWITREIHCYWILFYKYTFLLETFQVVSVFLIDTNRY